MYCFIKKNSIFVKQNNKDMTAFNSNFYQSNNKYTLEMAIEKLTSLGYSDFQFKSCSFTNGASFYFTSKDGEEIRVSDHPLTGKRAANTIQISLVTIKTFSPNTQKSNSDFQASLAEMIAKRNK